MTQEDGFARIVEGYGEIAEHEAKAKIAGNLAAMASIVRAYYRALRLKGFSAEDALILTAKFQDHYLSVNVDSA